MNGASRGRAITHRRILTIALPIVLSNATIPLLGVVDTGVIGQLGDPVPIGAVGIGAVIISAVYWVFGFLRMGTTGMTSQALGADDQGEADALLSRALIVGVGAGVALIILQNLIFAGAFKVSPASPEVEAMAREYLQIRVWSAPAAIALLGITGWLIADERTRAVLVLQLCMNGLNILLSVVFVIGLNWGIAGVATATFIAEWAGLVLGLWFCRGAFRRPFWREWSRVLERARLIAMATVNRDILLRSLMLQTIFVSFLFFGANFGDVPLAANQILVQFLYLTAYALDGFAFSAETLVGNAMGAKDRTRLRRAALLNSLWGGGIMVVFALCVALFGAGAIDLMTTSEEVRAAAKVYLPWVILAPVAGVASWMLDGIFIGATRTVDMRNMMAISTAFYFAAVWMLAPAYENHGLWAALILSFVARGVTLALRYPALERAAEA